jgi:hypothetical protein
MIKKDDEKYKVLEHKDFGGLTVGSYSLRPGTIFSRSQWKGKEESLKKALANKRCVLVKPKKKKETENDS